MKEFSPSVPEERRHWVRGRGGGLALEGAVVRVARGVAEVQGVLREEREVGVVAVAPGWAVGKAVGSEQTRLALDHLGSGQD